MTSENMTAENNNALGGLSIAIILVALADLPLYANGYILLLAGQIAIFTIAVAGLNILTGMTGLISLGHAAFFAVGAYVAAVGAKYGALPVLVTLPLSVMAAAGVGILVGLPSLRVKGFYLALATLSANFLVIYLIRHDWIAPLTGGVSGIEGPVASLFGTDLMSPAARYYLVFPFAVLSILLTQNIMRTRIGRAFIAIRDRDYSAEIFGISLVRYKLMSFAISAGFGGLAGGLWAYYFAAMQPGDFGLFLSMQLIAALIIGGRGTILGPVWGAVFIIAGPEILKICFSAFSGGDVMAQRYLSPIRDILLGSLIIGFLIFQPHGLAAFGSNFLSIFRQGGYANRLKKK